MNQYLINSSSPEVPALKVLAHTVTGAVSKAENVNAKLFPGTKIDEYMVKLIKRNVR